ncbi:hypothetical protein PILCRDRAFT_474446 [Piloderma croceum F 1598]|uniref:Uncharacterized protein n=1 Tax=Piloderma croceum (strain F 1598) TaxID=765440 RepID=A0A0C3B7M1_PILCF|nr:hypothetical protein PILCRDRAFT_474446 [Piloderma croceum F 1598]
MQDNDIYSPAPRFSRGGPTTINIWQWQPTSHLWSALFDLLQQIEAMLSFSIHSHHWLHGRTSQGNIPSSNCRGKGTEHPREISKTSKFIRDGSHRRLYETHQAGEADNKPIVERCVRIYCTFFIHAALSTQAQVVVVVGARVGDRRSGN